MAQYDGCPLSPVEQGEDEESQGIDLECEDLIVLPSAARHASITYHVLNLHGR